MNPMIFGLLRHVLTAAGGALAFSPGDTETVVGAILAIVGVVWSIYDKRGR